MTQAKGRIGYVDAMRGLAMFMVVIYHISWGCFHSKNILTDAINVQLELPLFFFISGFFADKICVKGYKETLKNRFSYLVIPTLIMMMLYCWVMGINFIDGLQYRLKAGYWFTLVLFEFNIIYILTDFLSKRCGEIVYKRKNIIHLIVGVALVYLASFSERYNSQYHIINTFSVGEFGHYIYFVIGSIVFSQQSIVFKVMNNKYLFGSGIILYILANIFKYKYGFAMFRLAAMLSVTLVILLGLFIIWKIFISLNISENKNTWTRFFSLVGQRSLDIYFIHYFILPVNMGFVGDFFAHYNIPFIEYVIAVIIALLITLASLGLGAIVRLSPVSAHWLLGVKNR